MADYKVTQVGGGWIIKGEGFEGKTYPSFQDADNALIKKQMKVQTSLLEISGSVKLVNLSYEEYVVVISDKKFELAYQELWLKIIKTEGEKFTFSFEGDEKRVEILKDFMKIEEKLFDSRKEALEFLLKIQEEFQRDFSVWKRVLSAIRIAGTVISGVIFDYDTFRIFVEE